MNQAPKQTTVLESITNFKGALEPNGLTNNSYPVNDTLISNGYTDADGNAGGIAITSVDTSKCILWYSTNGGSTWAKVSGVSQTHALLLSSASSNLLYYQAIQTSTNSNYTGQNTAVLTYRAWDQTTGANGGFADVSINGGASAFSTTERTMNGVILGTMDAPVVTAVSTTNVAVMPLSLMDAPLAVYATTTTTTTTTTTNANNAPTLTLNTTNTSINKNATVKLFNNVNAGGGVSSLGDIDTGDAGTIMQIVLNVKAVRDFENEILTIDSVDIPLKKTSSDMPFTNGGNYAVSVIGSTVVVTLKKLSLSTSTDINSNKVNPLIENITYKNISNTPTDGTRQILISNITDGGTTSTLNNPYAGTNYKNFGNSLLSSVTIDQVAPNAPSTLSVPENDNGGISVAEAIDGTVVVVSLTDTTAVINDVITVVIDGVSTQYTITQNDIDAASANVAIPKSVLDSAGQGSAQVTATIKDAAGNVSQPSQPITINLIVQNALPTGNVNISGTATQGQVLTASNTLADANGMGAVSYKWYADGNEISGATAATYTLTQAEVGKKITVTASYADGQNTIESVTSQQTSAVANINDAPTGSVTITGTATQGQVLTVSNTLADVDGLGTISYKWYANGAEISGATGNTFTLTQAQVGKAITAKASYTDGGNTVETVSSSATAPVANINDAPTGAVTITGTATQGQVLTVSNTLADVDGLGTISYKWYANGTEISGAIGNTFTLTQAQVGKAITAKASYTDGGNTVETVTSAATAAVANINDAPTGAVTITGTATQGQVLTVSNTLADVDGLGTISYKWYANGTEITGATAATYTLTQAEVGKAITAKASYTDGGNTVETVSSAATAAVANINDAPTGAVTITGTATQGQILTASNTLADVDGLGAISYKWYANGTEISGATAATYTLTQAEVGKAITAKASYTDGGNTVETVTSSATANVANINDAPTGAVTITGTATQGQVLTVSNTLADVDGLGTISYKWYANGTEISGATGNTFTLTQAQVGKAITAKASYTDGGNTVETVSSSATANVANINDAPTGAVTITGIATQGQVLTASNTLADVDGLGAISYKWYANGTEISGATAATYTLTQAEVGKAITAKASYTDGGNTVETVSSAATAAVANINDTPTGAVTITGTATQGQILSVSNTLADVDGLGTISYKWYANGTEISGATATTYTLTQAEVGKAITAKASYTDGGNTVETVTSSATAAVANINDAPTGAVTITGTATQGQVLTVSNTLADVDGLGTISYKWYANGTEITGATAATYTLTQAEVGKAITAKASYTDGGNTVETVTSSATAAVANINDAPTGAVTITGTATQGQVLTVSNTLADVDGLGTISYKWYANGTEITGATAATYTLTQAEVGKAITAKASYTDGGNTVETVTSSATAAVANINDAPTGAVTITGTATQGQVLTVSNTLADVDGLGAISYKWYANGTEISGATGNTFTLTQAQVGKAITAKASYTDGGNTVETVSSLATAAVANINDAPTGAVSITGTATQGQVLTVSNTLADVDGLGTISYKWYANGTEISGVTATTYTLTQAEVGKAITAKASYTDGGNTVETVSSAATANVADINDAPVLADTVLALPAIIQDAAIPTGAVGVLVSTLVGGVSDVDASATKGIAITATNTTNGALYYSKDAGVNWSALTDASESNARLLTADANHRLYYMPKAGVTGATANALTFRAWDGTSGTDGLTANITATGGTTAFSSNSDTVSQQIVASVTMNAVSTDNLVNGIETVVITGKADANAVLSINTGVVGTATANASGDWQYTVPKMPVAPMMRYVMVRDILDGSGAYGSAGVFDLSELNVMQGSTDLASGKPVNISWAAGQFNTVTDGNSGSYLEAGGTGEKWVQLDLGNYYRVDSIKVGSRYAWPERLNGAKIYTSLNDMSQMTSAQLDAATTTVRSTLISGTPWGGEVTEFQQPATDTAYFKEGNNTITATEVVSGLTNQASKVVTFDSVSPNAGSLSITDNGASTTDGITNSGVVTVGNVETGATWQYSTNSGSTWTAGTGTSFTLAQGTYAVGAVQIRETDKAGNVQTGSLITKNAGVITIDTTVPVISSAATATAISGVATTAVVYDANATDNNGAVDAAIDYTLTGADAAKFNINAATGEVKFVASPNFASPTDTGANNVYDFNVVATDKAGNATSKAVALTVLNSASVVTVDSATHTYVENAAAIVANSGIQITDIDSANLKGATVKISAASLTAGDMLSFTSANGITGSYNQTSGTLTLTGTATLAQYQTALQSVMYVSASDTPTSLSATRSLIWTVNDGTADSAPVTSTINVTAVNDKPILDISGNVANTYPNLPYFSSNELDGPNSTWTTANTLDFSTGSSAAGKAQIEFVFAISDNLWVSNADAIDYTTPASLSIYAGNTLYATIESSWSGYNNGTGLYNITYANGATGKLNNTTATSGTIFNANPTNSSQDIAFEGTNALATTWSKLLIDLPATVANSGALTLTATTTASSDDRFWFNDLRVYNNTALSSMQTYNIIHQNATNTLIDGLLVVMDAPAGAVNLSYKNASGQTVNIDMVSDDLGAGWGWHLPSGTSIPVGTTFTAKATQSNINGYTYWTEGQAPANLVTDNMTISDKDGSQLSSASISMPTALAGDRLLLNGHAVVNGETGTLNGIAYTASVTNSASTNGAVTITLSGAASSLAYKAALKMVAYDSVSQNPTGDVTTQTIDQNGNAYRTISMTVNDGSDNSTTATETIYVYALNDQPLTTQTKVTLGAVANTNLNPAGSTVSALFGSAFSDVDGNSFAGVMITGDAATAAQGAWQWLKGTTWTAIPTTSSISNALWLDAATKVRFLPKAGYLGAPGELSARVADSTVQTLVNGSLHNIDLNNPIGWGWDGATDALSATTVKLATTVAATVAPVVLDLNQDGQIEYSHINLDVNGDGQLDHAAWAGAQDGVLIWNKYADNHVHDNSQYAFTQYGGETDLQGLAVAFDTNHDGAFDVSDAKFSEFAVWQDANQNGISEEGEVRSLADAEITSVNVNSDGVNATPAEGVTEAGRSTAELSNGSSMLIADVAFDYTELVLTGVNADALTVALI